MLADVKCGCSFHWKHVAELAAFQILRDNLVFMALYMWAEGSDFALWLPYYKFQRTSIGPQIDQ